MALTKINYVDKVTIISADNMNSIQDNIISNKNEIDTLATEQTNLQTYIDNQISGTNSKITTLTTSLNEVNTKATENSTSIAQLQGTVEGNSQEINSLSDSITDATNKATQAMDSIALLNKVYVSAEEPSGARVGDIWFDTDDQATIEIDDTPISESENLITSGGVAEALNGKIEIIKLWENASPTSAFATQTITLDLNGYEIIIIKMKYRSDSDNGTIALFGVGQKQIVQMINTSSESISSVSFSARAITVNTTDITFEEGYNQEDVAVILDDNYAIPITIYGIKGVQ